MHACIVNLKKHPQVDFATKPQFWRTLHPPIKEKLGELLVNITSIIFLIMITTMIFLIMVIKKMIHPHHKTSGEPLLPPLQQHPDHRCAEGVETFPIKSGKGK